MQILLTFILFSTAQMVFGAPDLRPLPPSEEVIKEDVRLILQKAGLEGRIFFSRKKGLENQVKVRCDRDSIDLEVTGDERWSQALYLGVQKLGFLFPHPRIQISPDWEKIREKCGKIFVWKPAMKYYGFHLHTLHPSEWLHGFLMGKTDIAFDTIRWLARNQQNIFDLSLLDMEDKVIFENLRVPFELARGFGIHGGVTVGMAFRQQNHYKLIDLFQSFFESLSLSQLEERTLRLLDKIDLSYINLEAGTSEFTPTDYELSLKWMNRVAELAKRRGVAVVVKIHASSNQKNEKYGNFNFLPQFATPEVGVLPHTVFLYGVNDENAPMYGNKNFHHIRDFMLQEKDKRRTWFYPETSYFCVQDIDIPLLFTDYLLTRARDASFLFDNGIEGQLNFSTGHEVGYWLFDWTNALLNNLDFSFDPYIGLRLLGEDIDSWKEVVEFQHQWFIQKGLVSVVNFSSMGDEMITSIHQVLKRNLLGDLAKNPILLQEEITLLEEAIKHIPKELKTKLPELRALWNITRIRIFHALATRRAMADKSKKFEYLKEAALLRKEALKHMDLVVKDHSRYPEALTFERHDNPTAYKWGYAQPAKELQYWVREEEMIKEENYAFWFKAQFGLWELIDGWVL